VSVWLRIHFLASSATRDGDRLLRQVLVELVDHELENLDQVGLAQSQLKIMISSMRLRNSGLNVRLTSFLTSSSTLSAMSSSLVDCEAEALALLQMARADVRGHDDDGVLEVDSVAETVGQLAVFENLEKDVEDIRDAPSRFRRAGRRSKGRA
jgi:hypothetical protein